MLLSYKIIPLLDLLELFLFRLSCSFKFFIMLLLQLKLLLCILIIYIVQLAVFIKKLKLQLLGLKRVSLEDFFDFTKVLIRDLIAEKLVNLLQ